MSDERLIVLEQRVSAIDTTVNSKLDRISEALHTLVRIEERQIQQNQRLDLGTKTFGEHDDRIRKLEKAMPENLDKRLNSIETKMPGLVESRTWVVMGLLGGIGMIGTALLALVFK